MLKPASGSYKVHKHTHTQHILVSCCYPILLHALEFKPNWCTILICLFVLFYTLHSTHSPIHPPTHPTPSPLLLPLHFFWLDHNEKTHNQSWLAGFFRGVVVVYTCSLLFKKAGSKKVRYCSSTSSLSVKNAEDVVTTSPTRKKAFWGRGRALME